MGRPSRKILELREAAKRGFQNYYLHGRSPTVAVQPIAAMISVAFDVPIEVALKQVEYAYYQLTHDGKRPHRGPPPDTTAHLGPARCAWLKAHGGKQPTIKRLVDEAMHVEQAIRDLAHIIAEDKLVKIP